MRGAHNQRCGCFATSPCLQDEAEQLENAITARHKAELDAWELANPDHGDGTTSFVAASTGLYDLKIGDAEDKHAKVSALRRCKCAWPLS